MLNFLLSITDESDHSKIIYLYNTYHNDMIKLAKYRLKKSGLPNYELDSEDVVQNAFVKISKYINSINFEVSEKELRAYILSIVANETNRLLKEHRYFDDIDAHEADISDESFFEKIEIQETYDIVIEQIKRMDEKYSITLLFYYCEEMSVKEIAGLMDISEKTVYSRLMRGKRLLLEFMGAGDLGNE